MTISVRSTITLFIAVLFLTGYSFMGAAWTAPTGTPPANNTEAPITVSDTTQTKEGRLNLYSGGTTAPVAATMFRTNGHIMGNIFISSNQMRSPLYCDEVGANCFDPSTIYKPVAVSCPSGQAIRSISANGTPTCSALTTTTGGGGGGGYHTTTGCGSCPSGCHLINIGGSCSSNNSTYLCGCN